MEAYRIASKRPGAYALKVNPNTSQVYLYDGYRQLFSFDSHITPVPDDVTDWPTVGYTENIGPWRDGEYTTVAGWYHFLADLYHGPCIALHV